MTRRLQLSEAGTLSVGERALIKAWLYDNFCTTDTFECELHELPDGGFALEDAQDALASDDDAFGIYVLDGRASLPSLLVVLFEPLPQGILIDRATTALIGAVIEGEIREVAASHERYMHTVAQAVPVLR